MLRFLLIIVVFICLCQTSAANEDVFVVGLFENAVYEKVTDGSSLNSSIENGQHSLRASIINLADVTERIGFHGYLPQKADIVTFSMTSGGDTYHAKKSSQEMAQEILNQARSKNHNAAVFCPQVLSDGYGHDQQSSDLNVNIKPGHRLDFHLVYQENPLITTSSNKANKATNKAHVVLDFYATSAVSLIGEIASPNYPIAYPDNAHITWLVRVPDGFIVQFEIVDLVIEECCDRLTIFDGVSPYNVTVADVTGNLSQFSLEPFHSSGNNMFLRLTSDCSVALGGFSAITRALLPSTFNNTFPPVTPNVTLLTSHNLNATFTEKILTSPGYPDQHPNHVDTSWKINAVNSSYVIRLRVIDMDLESCCDHLSVHDGPTEKSPLLATLSGQVTDVIILSNNDSVYVTFMSDGSVRKMGFQIAYSMVLPAGSYPTTTFSTPATPTHMTYTDSYDSSGNSMTLSPDVKITPGFSTNSSSLSHSLFAGLVESFLYSPDFPSSYPHNINIAWSIRSFNRLYAVKVTVIQLNLESCCDKLYVYDGPIPSYPLLDALTGNITNKTFQSSQNYLYVNFVSDNSTALQGFEIKYSSVLLPQKTCSNSSDPIAYLELTTSYGFVTVPECYSNHSWHIYTNWPNQTLQLWDTYNPRFSLSYGDELLIYDGPSSEFTLLAHVKHSESFPYIYSTTNNLYVEFISRNISKSEFVLQAYLHFECRHTRLYAEPYDQYFSSPGYPNSYLNMHCSWNIFPRYYNEAVEITILNYEGDRHQYLYLYNEQSNTHISSLTKPDCSWKINGSFIGINFHTSGFLQTSKGFYAKYRSIPAPKTREQCPYSYQAYLPNSVQYLYFHLSHEYTACLYFPSISMTSAISLRFVDSNHLNESTSVTIYSRSKGILANFTDVQDKKDFDLGIYPYSDVFVRAESFFNFTRLPESDVWGGWYGWYGWHNRYITIEYEIV
ncbi:unnamed protein product [Clavelina lepadiformis]|uniref:CUB domain-containing protein n=1 Tax=Clavelina lepadiformis TaxID=159417 RepID=A0ABP0FTM3_CLALP